MNKLFSSFAIAGSCVFLIACAGCDEQKPVQPSPFPSPEEAVIDPSPDVRRPADPETVLAMVDETPVTQAELDKETDKIKLMMQRSGLTPDQMEAIMPDMEVQIMDALVIRALLENECEKQNIVISDEDVKSEIDKIQVELAEDISLDELLEQSGVSRAVFEDELKEKLKIEKLLDISEPGDEQVAAYYEENKELFEVPESVQARHILIKADADDDEETRTRKKERAEEIRSKLQEGADFVKLAQENSDCPSNLRGGSLGDVRRGQMVPPFEEATFALDAGEISEVVETQFGYHVIEALSRTQETAMTLDEAAPQIKAHLKAESFRDKAASLIDNLKEKATITYSEGVERGEM